MEEYLRAVDPKCPGGEGLVLPLEWSTTVIDDIGPYGHISKNATVVRVNLKCRLCGINNFYQVQDENSQKAEIRACLIAKEDCPRKNLPQLPV